MLRLPSLICLALAMALVTPARAQAPRTIAYQGVLADGGTPVTAATSVTFRLFDAATAGTAVWTEVQTVTPDADGVFAVQLGAVADLDDLDFGEPLWLELTIPSGGGSVTFGPRTPFDAAPYALGLYGIRVTPPIVIGYAPSIAAGHPSNEASGLGAVVAGGGSDDGVTVHINQATGAYSTVSGGWRNTASSDNATVGGGFNNTASSSATVGGGDNNTASGPNAMVPGGRANHARGAYSFAAGYNARAVHDGTFVWSDNSQFSADSLVSTGQDQFLIRAAGGVGIGTNTPSNGQLKVQNNGGAGLSSVTLLAENESTAAGIAGRFIANGTDATLVVDQAGSGDIIKAFSSGNLRFRIQNNGTVTADGSFTGGGADFAEYVPLASSSEAPRAGDVVGVTAGRVGLATEGAEQVMIVSSNPAFVGNPDAAENGALVALVGQAEVRLASPAQIGDLLVASGGNDGMAKAVSPARYAPATDGPVIGRVLALAEDGRAVALVGIDEAAALRAVVVRQQNALAAQQRQLAALTADRDRQQAQIDALARRLDAQDDPNSNRPLSDR